MKKRGFLSIVLIVLLSSCAMRSAMIIKKTTAPELAGKTVVINYIENRSAIIVPVYIKGKKYRFVYDTGAQATLISKEIMDEIGIKEKSHINIADSRNYIQKLQVSVLDSIELSPNLIYTNVGVLVYDFNKTPAFSCLKIDGVIGTNIIRENNWKLNFDQQQLEISGLENKIQKTENTTVLPFRQDHRGVPYVDLYLNGQQQEFMVDIGKNSELISISSALEFDQYEYKTIGYSSFGLFGKNNPDTIVYGAADITDSASFTIKNINLIQAKNTSSLIGVGFLKKYYHSAVFDYTNNQLLLDKRKNIPRETKKYPISVVVGENNLTVSSKEIHLTDIQIGDTIVGVNAIHFNGTNTCELVREIKKSREKKEQIILQVNSDGVVREFIFSLHSIRD